MIPTNNGSQLIAHKFEKMNNIVTGYYNINSYYSFNKYNSNINLIAASLYYKFLCEVLKENFIKNRKVIFYLSFN